MCIRDRYTALEDRGVHLTEEETDLPALDETQIGRLEHELSAEGVALDLSLIHISDYGIVGDLFKVVPELLKQIEAAKAAQ